MKKFSPERLRKAREIKKWTISDLHYCLAHAGIRVSLQSLRHWEKGKRVPSSNNLAALAKTLGRGIEYFFDQKIQQNTVVRERNCWIDPRSKECRQDR